MDDLAVQFNVTGMFVPNGASTLSVEKSLRAMRTLQIIAQQPDSQQSLNEFATLNVKAKIETCLSNFSTALSSSSGAGFSDAQMQLIDSSIQTLSAISQMESGGDSLVSGLDLPLASSIMPLLLHSAELPTASSEVFRTIARIGSHNPVILESLCETSFPTTLLSICKNDSLTGPAAAAAFECFSLIAANPVVLDTMAPTAVAPIICQRIADSLVDEGVASDSLPSLVSSLAVLTEGAAQVEFDEVTQTFADMVDYFATVIESVDDRFDEKPVPTVISGAVIAQSMEIMKNVIAKAGVSRVTEGAPVALDKLVSIACHNEYDLLRDEKCASAFCSLVETIVAHDGSGAMIEHLKTSLEIQEPLLQAMNFHSSDMSLQRRVAGVVSKFGVEGLISSVAKVVERVDDAVVSLAPSVASAQKPEGKLLQVAESARVLNNLLLLDTAESGGFNSSQIFQSLMKAVETVNMCVATAENEVSRGDADETLSVCIQALAKVLAIDASIASSAAIVNAVLPVAVESVISNACATTAKSCAVHLLRMIADSCTLQSLIEIVDTPAYQVMCKTLVDQQGKLAVGSSATSHHGDASGLLDMKIVVEKVSSRLLSPPSLTEIAATADGGIHVLVGLFKQASILSTTASKKGNFTPSALLKNIISCPALGHAAALNLLTAVCGDPAYTTVAAEVTNVLLSAVSSGVDISGGRAVSWGGVVSSYASSTAVDVKLLPLIEAAAAFSDGARTIAQNSAALEAICGAKGLMSCDSKVALQSAILLTQLAAHQDSVVLETLQAPAITKSMLSAMKEASAANKIGGEEIVQSIVYVLRLLSDVQGFEKLNLPRETIRILQVLVYIFVILC